MDEDGSIEEALGIGTPPLGDTGSAGERVLQEVLKDSIEYLIQKGASGACGHRCRCT